MSEMPSKIQLEVVTPDHELVHEEVDSVEIPAKNGYIGVLPGHAPLLTELGVGDLKYKQGGRTEHMAIVHGYAEVLPERVIVLADVGERAGEIDLKRAKEAHKRAMERLAKASKDGADWQRAADALERAKLRMEIAGVIGDREGAVDEH